MRSRLLTKSPKNIKDKQNKGYYSDPLKAAEAHQHHAVIPDPPIDVIRRLQELKKLKRSLNRPEMEYIINAFKNYNCTKMQRNTKWTGTHVTAMKQRLYATTVVDGYDASPILDYIALDSVNDVFNKINAKNGYLEPKHQQWLINRLDYICRCYARFEEFKLANYRFCYSCPPRSSKTLLIYSFIFKALLENPHLRIVYVSNNLNNTKRCSSTVRNYLRNIGVMFSCDINNSTEFIIDSIPQHNITNIVCGGGLQCYTALSIPQGITADILIVDDIYSSRQEAESTVQRDKINESFFANASTRLTTNGCIIVISTRYHQQDLIGILTDQNGPHKYEYTNLPAISKDIDGNDISYWPKYWPIKKLLKIKATIGSYNWESMYMGNPRPKEDRLINDISRYEDLPSGCKYVYAIDLAYSEKTKADYSTIVKMYRSGDTYYVSDIQRWRQDIDLTLKRIKSIVESSECHWSYGAIENAIISLAKSKYDLTIKGYRTTSDKYTRALPFASNISNIYFHKSINQDIIDEILNFNGSGSGHDDVVDSCVTCYTVLSSSKNTNTMSFNDANKMFSGIKLNSRLSFGSVDDDDDD